VDDDNDEDEDDVNEEDREEDVMVEDVGSDDDALGEPAARDEPELFMVGQQYSFV